VVSFVVYGEPVPQARARVTTNSFKPHGYEPEKSRNYKELVRLIAQQNRPITGLLNGPIKLQVDVYRSIPRGFSKKRAAQAEAGEIRPTGKPDLDNYVKLIEDACNGVIWTDDARIVNLIAGKFYSTQPRIEVTIWQISTMEKEGTAL